MTTHLADGDRPLAVFPFVVGVGRSGTTLLQAMLNAHPELAMPFESHFIVPFAERHEEYERPDGFDTERFICDLLSQWSFQRWEIAEPLLRAALTTPPPRDLAAAVRRVFALYAATRDKVRYGDKTPDYSLSLPFLARLFPESRFVHVIRDGRDVALALRDMDWMRQRDIVDCALYWALRVETARRAGRWLGPHRYAEVRYDELVREPEPTLRRVCAFLSLPFRESMLEHQSSAVELVHTEPNANEFRTLHLPLTPGLRDWRTQLTADDLKSFEQVAGDVLEDFGYARSGDAGVTREAEHLAARVAAMQSDAHPAEDHRAG